MFGPLSFWEVLFISVLALVVFGPRKLPELGKTLGKGIREFKRATEDLKSNWQEHMREADNPLNEVKQTLQDVRSDVETSIQKATDEVAPQWEEAARDVDSAINDVSPAAPDATPAVDGPVLEEASKPFPEETKPDAH